MSAHAVVTESLTYDSYTIAPVRGQNLVAALNATSPIKEGGRSYGGTTKWNVRWGYLWKSGPTGSCSVASVNVSLTATITLPQLVGGDARQQRIFAAYLAALKVHEMGHYRFGQEAANAVEAQLKALPAAATCGELDASARATAGRILESYGPKEAQYDRATGHGRSQGAELVD